ncbi:hypothetical protein [Streptomyces sp. SID2119]|uniref:hypothetical protein n=1 Tax=Streptomyces sp. SID2119 TaxID=2690253 RepID=UPI00136E24E1|nr:hypothetical protein [Streptomyces sp. SID2119]MYW30377.1 hypothetical protein [Streptomyces sp. SID2119]
MELDLDAFLDPAKSLNEGALLHPDFSTDTWYWLSYAESGLYPADRPLADFTAEEWQLLLRGELPEKLRLEWQGNTLNIAYEGLVDKFTRLYIKKEDMSERSRRVFERFVRSAPCRACDGSRLAPAVRASRIAGCHIGELATMEARRLAAFLAELELPQVKPVLDDLITRLRHLDDIGLGYLSLDRQTRTLSGGESQRIKMVRHLSSDRTGMLYVFDEPSVGLHARDVHRLKRLLVELRDEGNTVSGANGHNLKDVSVDFPTGVLTVITGVAGSGKSSLVNDDFLSRCPDAIVIDQTAVTANRRSYSATYTGLMDPIRKMFAKANGVSASLFSANSKGACPNCQGLSVVP